MKDYKAEKRKLHDFWAFVVFVIYGVTVNFLLSMQNTTQIAIFGPLEMKDYIYVAACIYGTIFVFGLGLYFFPTILMHISPLILPFLTAYEGFIMSGSFKSSNFIAAAISSVISLIIYFVFIMKNVKYSAAVAKAGTTVLFNNFMSFVIIVIIGTVPTAAQSIYALSKISFQTEKFPIWAAVVIMQTYWLAYFVYYAQRVTTATLTYLEIVKTDNSLNTFCESYKNTLFAVGSCALGSFLLALVSTLRWCVSRNSRNDNENLITKIIQLIALILLKILETIIQTLNSWGFIYLAIHGTSYKDSLSQSLELITKGDCSCLINSFCLNSVLIVYMCVTSICFFTFRISSIRDSDIFTLESLATELAIGFIIILGVQNGLNCFLSAAHTIMLTYEIDPVSVEHKHSKAANALREQKLKK
ncbi:hypothetical protein EDEG_02996 [Edhazardia aedis USNM 41457]|uniref:Protein PNS1 n=1 Tax=Edhazardia aedis (strain USNM 41457) TaxID=1003232 RepID=J9D4Z7_EDHAE|nr:hypothetical protein EDEG_02996 [Edhazardia aedis USNM 41457]|eukprot:EJW02599.1 hypothetical protein EDEG_02996 [Edhazardia aedis USNM 41457]